MKKTLITLLISGIFTSSAAMAITNSFSVAIDMQNVGNNLTIAETTAMVFPTIIVDGSTKAGAKCYTSNNSTSLKELCRNTTANTAARHDGVYEITGSSLAPISLTLSGASTANGMQLSTSFATSSPLTSVNHILDASGKISDAVAGHLELIDPAGVLSQTTTFTYDITAAYN